MLSVLTICVFVQVQALSKVPQYVYNLTLDSTGHSTGISLYLHEVAHFAFFES
jgi:hypothetical protein